MSWDNRDPKRAHKAFIACTGTAYRRRRHLSSTELFARKASGLARNISAYEVLIFDIMWMWPVGTWIYGIWAMLMFPGVDLPTTTLISWVVSIVVAAFYATFSSSMPRSGGDYIWMSRVLHPAIGYAMNFFFAVACTSFVGVCTFYLTGSLASMFDFLGNTGLASWLNSVEGTLVIAVPLYIFFGALISSGVRRTHIFIWVLFVIGMIAIVVYNVTLLSVGSAGFKANFNAFSGMDYDKVIMAGTQAGVPASYTLGSTILGVAFTYFSFTGYNCSIYHSAEIKDVRKSQFIAIVGSTLIYVCILYIDYFVTVTTVGPVFYNSLTYLWGTGSPEYILAFPPFFQNVFRYACIGNPAAYAFVCIGFAALTLASLAAWFFSPTRMIFAWAFDRVVPVSLAKIDTKYSSPYVAIILVTVGNIVTMLLYAYTNLLAYFLYATCRWMVMQAFVAITGIVFPWRRKDIFDTSPEIVKKKVAGVPLITLLGIGTLICSIYIAYASVAPAYMGTFQPGYLGFTIGLMIAGAIIYGISSVYHGRTGIPLELTFKEIPPE